MPNKIEINKLIDEFKSIDSNDKSYRKAKKIINVDVVNSLIHYYNQQLPVTSFIDDNHLPRRVGTHIYRFFLRRIYSRDELITYTRDTLSKYINSINHLFTLSQTEAFRFMHGYCGASTRNENEIFYLNVFREGYTLFKNTKYWNKNEIIKIIRRIENGDSFTDILVPLDSCNLSHMSKIIILDNYIIPEIGLENFNKYIEARIKIYRDNIDFDYVSANLISLYFDNLIGINYDSAIRYVNSNCVNVCFRYISRYVKAIDDNYMLDKIGISEEELQEIHKFRQTIYFNHPRTISLKISKDSLMRYGDITLADCCKYIDNWFDKYKLNNRASFKNRIGIKDIFKDCPDPVVVKNVNWANYNHSTREYSNYLSNFIQTKIYELKEYYLSNNNTELSEEKDKYILMYRNKENQINSNTFDFSIIKSESIKHALRSYIRFYFSSGKLFQGNIRDRYFGLTVNFLHYIENNFNISTLNNIDTYHIRAYILYLSNIGKASANYIKTCLVAIRFLFDFSIENLDIGIYNNPAKTIIIKYAEEHAKNVPHIPEEILAYLDNHIFEWNDINNRLIYEILSWTGLRFIDAKNVTVNNLKKIDDNVSSISVETSKTKKSLIRKQMDTILTDYIPTTLYNEIEKYIIDTDKKRKKYNTDLVFFRIVNNAAVTLDDGKFIKSINSFLQSNNITTINGDYWNLTTRQPRKTVAYTLINNGASISDVQQKLNHITDHSTKKYYAEVNRRKLADLNHEFYKKKFNYLISEERLELYSEEERRKLYKDFCLNNRITELGVCTLHPSEGRCDARINGSCASCTKICTGPLWLEKWEALRNDSIDYINKLISIYKSNEIDENEYSNFIEYKQEIKMLDRYNKVIKEIKNEK